MTESARALRGKRRSDDGSVTEVLATISNPEREEEQRVSDVVHRGFLLTPWTAAGRGGVSLEHLAYISELVDTAYADLPKETKNFFGRYQIGPSDWELIRRTPQYTDPETGATMLRFEDISTHDDARLTGNKQQRFDVTNKLAAGILSETNYAVIGVSPRVHALTTAGQPAGSFWGEVARNATLFKQFPLTIYHMHWNRILATKDIRTKAEAAAWLFLGTTGMGALGLQMQQVSKGRDPLDMTEPRFWAAAAIKGGSLGLFGDFLYSDQNRFGGSLMETIAGPVGSQITNPAKLTVGNAQELLAGEDTHFGRELWRFVENMLPGHTGWYLRLAFKRLISDKIEEAIDPDAPSRFSRIEDRARRDYNQKFWWRPGRTAPDRGPDFGAAAP